MQTAKRYETEDHLILQQLPKEALLKNLQTEISRLGKESLWTFQVSLSQGVRDHIGEIGHIEYASLGRLPAGEPFAVIESTKAATELSFDFPVLLLRTEEKESGGELDLLVEIGIEQSDSALFLKKVRERE